jgi:AcrR family transcriptional regulator
LAQSRFKLTDAFASTAEPQPGKKVFVWDSEQKGFGLCLSQTGQAEASRSYVVQYRTRDGRTKRITLGRHGVLGAEQARAMARTILANADNPRTDPGHKAAADNKLSRDPQRQRTVGSERGRPRIRMTGAERRRQIIAATEAIVAEHGVDGATTARIAQASGIAEKTLYSHFSSRREILVAALDAVFDRARYNTFLRREDSNVLDHLRKTLRSDRLQKGQFVYPLYEFFAAPQRIGLREELRERHETSIQLLMKLVDEGKAQGTIREEVDSYQTAWDFMALYWTEDLSFLLGFEIHEQTSVMLERIVKRISTAAGTQTV